ASSDGPSGGPFGGGLLPGTFDVGILADMAAMEGSSADQLVRLNSLRDLAFLGAEATASKEKFFGYTTLSRGVLADVKNGGLKKDLTIAFENADVFASVFPKNNHDRYLVLDPEKRPPELED